MNGIVLLAASMRLLRHNKAVCKNYCNPACRHLLDTSTLDTKIGTFIDFPKRRINVCAHVLIVQFLIGLAARIVEKFVKEGSVCAYSQSCKIVVAPPPRVIDRWVGPTSNGREMMPARDDSACYGLSGGIDFCLQARDAQRLDTLRINVQNLDFRARSIHG